MSRPPYTPPTLEPSDIYTPHAYPTGGQAALANTGTDFPTIWFGVGILLIIVALILIAIAYLRRPKRDDSYEYCWCGHIVERHLDDQPDQSAPCSVCTCNHYVPENAYDRADIIDMRRTLKIREYEED